MADLIERLQAALTDRYTIQRELGRGGMAIVFLAEDKKHNRPVALKVLRPEVAQALGAERFLREIELTARLDHPHILPLLDSGSLTAVPPLRNAERGSGGEAILYYVMPYVEGESLRDRLDREKQLPLDDALQIVREVADALGYAHSHGVIHRDIKPENILLAAGHARVADFGIARAITEAGGERLTETGLAVGTVAYMSPEQAAGEKDLDGRSDLYSLGCVLYEMLAGEPPHTGPTPHAVLAKRLSEPIPHVSVVRETVPAALDDALVRALAKAPADRFPTAATFAEALTSGADAGARAGPASTGPEPRQGIRRVALVGAGGVALVAIGLIALSTGDESAAAPELPYPRTALAVLPLENLSAAGPHAYFAGGLHDELLTQLAKVSALSVRGRTSVRGYAETSKPVTQVAAELQVGTLVEGSVQVVGDRLRVNIQLLDAAIDEHLWAQRYDRDLDDAFAVQSEIARRIVTAVGAQLTEPEARAIAARPTENAEAYRLYLQAEEYRARPANRHQDLANAQQLHERAVALDSTFALAYAALSRVHGQLYWFGYDPYPARLERQRAAAEAALRLAPDLPQAHLAMGMVHYRADRDYARALGELTRAADGLPGSGELWEFVGYTHRRLGNWDEALAMLEKATALNPRDVWATMDLGGLTLGFLHRYAEAVDAFNRALTLAPDFWTAQLRNALTYLLWRGELDTLRNVLRRGPAGYSPYGPTALWRVRLALWERRPDSLLTLLEGADAVTFEAQHTYEPTHLYTAWAHQLRGDHAAVTRAFNGALVQLDSALRTRPNDWRMHSSRGLALAGLGRQGDARREAEWLTQSTVYRRDAYDRSYLAEARAMILAQAGLVDEALAELQPLLAGPSVTSAYKVRLDPRWDPIRDDPRFQALLARYTPPQPVEVARR